MTPKSQYFNGYKFTRGAEGTYYRCAKLKKRMHVYVWEYYNGSIPKGYEVHHIDFDKSNNDISNLQLLTIKQHRKLHADLLTDEQREWKRNNLNTNARPKAAEWHKSEEGRLWHSQHLKEQHLKEQFRYKLVCVNCGKQFIGKKANSKYCNNKCKSAYRRKQGENLTERVCVICNTTFFTDKYKQSKTCSRSCTNRYRRIKDESKIS